MNRDNIILKENNTSFLKFCRTAITIIMIILTGYLFLLSIWGTSMLYVSGEHDEITAYLTDSPFLHLSAIVILFLLGYLTVSHFHKPSQKSIKIFLIGIHGVMIIAMLILISVCRPSPVDVQLGALNSAHDLLNRNYNPWKIAGYNYIYPHLNFLTLFLVPLVSLFGTENSIIIFRILNLGMLIFASYSLYGFCEETQLNSTLTSILFILYLPFELYIFFIYGNIISLSLSFFAIWMASRYCSHHRLKDALLCTLSIALGIQFKETTMIPMIAIMIIWAIYGLFMHQKNFLFWIPMFIILYLACGIMVNGIITAVTSEKVPEGMGYYGHLTMGISEGERANGWYNSFPYQTLTESNWNFEQYNITTQEAYKQRLVFLWNHPSYTINFFSKKTASQWNNPTFQSLWIYQRMLQPDEFTVNSLYIDGSALNMIYYFIFNIAQSLILFGSFCFFIYKSRNTSLTALIPAITFIGGFIFLLFWEAKAQYTLLFFIMLFPYATTGYISLYKNLAVFIKSCLQKQWHFPKELIIICLLLCCVLFFSITNFEIINNTLKLGTDDNIYNDYLEQNIYFYTQFLQK